MFVTVDAPIIATTSPSKEPTKTIEGKFIIQI